MPRFCECGCGAKVNNRFVHGHSQRGQTGWNKGLTKETDPRVRAISKHIKEAMSREETIRRRKEASIKNREKRRNAILGRHHSEETKNKMSRAHRGKHPSEEHKQKIRLALTGKKLSEERKKHITESIRRLWRDKEYRERTLWNIFKSSRRRPSSLEKKFSEFFKLHHLQLAYCGDGSLLIDFKNPDFCENNGRKLCIEICDNNPIDSHWKEHNYERKRIEHFAKHGWKCLVIWEDELQDEKGLLQRINTFLGDSK